MKNKYMFIIAFIMIFSIVLTGCTGVGDTGVGDTIGNDDEIIDNEVDPIVEDPIVEDIAKDDTIVEDDAIDDKVPDVEIDSRLEEILTENKILIDKNKELELQLGNNNNNNNNNNNSSTTQTLINFAYDIMQMIKDNDMVALSNHVHPIKNLSFTPNVHIVIGRDKVFTAQEVAALPGDNTVYNWGYFLDEPFDEMHLNFDDYYESYIYDEDYINVPNIGINSVINTGDEIDNIDNEYPNAEFVEFMLVGPTHNTGSDWRSLKLVFEEVNGQRYLMAIVHGQWIDIQGH